MNQTVADPRIGTVLGGYRIEALVGRGGMGVVYRAEDLRLQRKVALKLLPPELSQDAGFRERFLRESRLAASLDHQNIIPIYDAGETDGVLYIAMRYVEGTDLRTLLREGALDPRRAIGIAGQVASALDAAHARGLVHRDVKPANILIASEPESEDADHVYLSDFGLTKTAGPGTRLTTTGQFVGTIDYVSPEQIRGGEVDGRSDLYSLGCVLYESLTGEPPFRRGSDVAVVFAHLEAEPPAASATRPDLPRGLDPVLATALAKDPAERFSTCREFVVAARRELGISSSAIQSRPVVAIPAPSASRRRVRLGLAGVAAAVIAAVAAVVIVLVAGGGGDGGRAAPSAPTQIGVDSLSSLDPATDAFLTSTAVGARPQSLAVSDDGIWVANFDDRTVSRVDPAGVAFAKVIGAGGTPTGIAVGEGAVWVTNGFEGKVTRIDPGKGAIDDSIETGSGTQAIAVGEGAVWVANGQEGTLLRIDPATGDVSPPIEVGKNPTGVAVGAGSVWVANSGDKTLSRIDPATGEVVETIGLRFAPQSVAVGPSGVWVTNSRDDSVSRVDLATNRVATTVEDVGDGPAGIAVTEDAVWVTNAIGGTIVKIDPASNTVVSTVEIGNSPDGIAVAPGGTVWFTTHAP